MYMSIVCEKCNHVLSKTIITGHLIHEIAAFITKILPYLPKTKTVTDDMATKIKNMGEDALVVSANVIGIVCPICHKYEYWTTPENIQKIKQLAVQKEAEKVYKETEAKSLYSKVKKIQISAR